MDWVPSQYSGLVLVVDDEANARSALSALLTDEGFRVSVAATGSEAMGQLERESPDALVVDVRLPDGNGLDIARAARSAAAAMPIVVITQLVTDHVRRRTRSLDARLLEKPVDFEELLASLRGIRQSSLP